MNVAGLHISPKRIAPIIIGSAYVLVAISLLGPLYELYTLVHNSRDNLTLPNALPIPPQANVNNSLSKGWFGNPTEPMLATGNETPALELRGTSSSGKSSLAGAYIAESGKPESFYHEGDSLPANTGKLSKIYSDHVTIEGTGKSYLLAFPTPKTENTTDLK